MLPENLKTYKTSGLEFPYQTYQYYLKNGYAPQFMQNTLHFNNGNETFSETAYLSGIAAKTSLRAGINKTVQWFIKNEKVLINNRYNVFKKKSS